MTTPPEPIQIWQPAGDTWIRPPQSVFGDHYAAQQTLRKRTSPQGRVVLVGESVAAGYLFAPHFTPALALQARLDSWEVVDLARTNESLESLTSTIGQALQLDPDVMVMWAGNNWMLRDLSSLSPYHPESTSRAALGRILDQDGPGAVTAFAERKARDLAMPRLAHIAEMLASRNIRLVVVVPEVNLVDWEHAQPVTVLPGGAEARWYDALDAGDVDQMVVLDQGSCASTHRLAAATATGRAALDSYRAEVAAATGPLRGCVSSPMATGHIQNLLREWAGEQLATLVDVPAMVAAEGVPDRNWFLDYCHHTAPAIDRIMSRTASQIDPSHTGTAQHVEPELLAVAALGALMHTDHRLVSLGDRLPRLIDLLRSATQDWAGTTELARDLVESRLGGAPVPLGQAQRRNLKRRYPFGFAHGWRPHTAEAEALTALGLDGRDASLIQLSNERSWPADRLWRPGQQCWTDEQPGSRSIGYFRAIQPDSRFAILMRPAIPVELEITARAPVAGSVSLRLGGSEATIELDKSWTTHQVTLEPDATWQGLHPLVITWPRLDEDGDRWHNTVSKLKADQVPELHPVFGEVHSLRVKRVLDA